MFRPKYGKFKTTVTWNNYRREITKFSYATPEIEHGYFFLT